MQHTTGCETLPASLVTYLGNDLRLKLAWLQYTPRASMWEPVDDIRKIRATENRMKLGREVGHSSWEGQGSERIRIFFHAVIPVVEEGERLQLGLAIASDGGDTRSQKLRNMKLMVGTHHHVWFNACARSFRGVVRLGMPRVRI